MSDAADDHRAQNQVGRVLARLARPLFHILPRVAHECRRGDAGCEQPISNRTRHLLQHWSCRSNVNRWYPARSMRVRLQPRDLGRKNFPLISKCIALKHALDDLNALPHHRGGSYLLPFAFTNLLHENLGGAEAQKKSVARQILHYPCFHRDLHGMACVGRDNAPAQSKTPGLVRNHGQDRSRRACFKRMLAPPWIRFRNPEAIEPCFFAGLRHGYGFPHRLHAKL